MFSLPRAAAYAKKPNLGNFADPPEWAEILQYFRGSELQNYFTNILEDKVRVRRAAPVVFRTHARCVACPLVCVGERFFHSLTFPPHSRPILHLQAVIKPQYVDILPRKMKGTVRESIERVVERDNFDVRCRLVACAHLQLLLFHLPPRLSQLPSFLTATLPPPLYPPPLPFLDALAMQIVCQELELTKLLDREIKQLSGGELQRFACAMICVQDKTVLMFDEPSSYLDVRQRLVAARIIRALRKDDK